MTHPFPAKSVELNGQAYAAFRAATTFNLKRKYDLACSTMDDVAKYGFFHHLRTGQYAPWPHEAFELHIPTDNCTTVIPHAYLMLEAHGMKPEIVQFMNFRTIREDKTDEENNITYETHFAFLIDVGRKHTYLFDPFWHTCGPILEQTEHSMRVGKSSKSEKITRKYAELIRYTPEEFAAMMERLHDPADSLDMVVAGQEVYKKRIIQHQNCQLMVWYDDEKNELTTRMYVPQIGFANKAVYCRMHLNETGDVEQTSLELVVAKDTAWKKLVGEVPVARTNYQELRQLQKLLQGVLRHGQRLGPALLKADADTFNHAATLAGVIFERLANKEREALGRAVAGRTLYEFTTPNQEYLSTAEQRDTQLHQWLVEYYAKFDEREVSRRALYRHAWRLERKSRREAAHLQVQDEKLEKEKEKHNAEYERWMNLRQWDHKGYALARDKFLFGETLNGRSFEDLTQQISDLGADMRIGYLGILADYVPFVFHKHTLLELKPFRASLKEKVAARRAKRKAK